jgi:Flp pilus assembly protein TadG
MMRLMRDIRDDDRGHSFLELGFALPIFATLLIGTVDISRAVSERLKLEQAAQRTVELLQIKDFKFDSATDDRTIYQSEAASAAGVATSAVTVDAWLQCNSTVQTPMDQSHYNGTCNSGEVMARYVNIRIQKSFTPLFGTKYFPGANANGTFTLTANAGVRVQ